MLLIGCLEHVLSQNNTTENTKLLSEKVFPPSISLLPLPLQLVPAGLSRLSRATKHGSLTGSQRSPPWSETWPMSVLEIISSAETPETDTLTVPLATNPTEQPVLPPVPPPPQPPPPPPVPYPNHVSVIGQNPEATMQSLPTPAPKPPSRPSRPNYRQQVPAIYEYKPNKELLHHVNLRDEQGGYLIDFLTGNSVYRMEKGYFKDDPKDENHKIHVKTGAYGFTSPDGVKFRVDFIADENGFRAYESIPS
ncbi:uncharacterized protein isoform X2 [Rhodnius prolixus]